MKIKRLLAISLAVLLALSSAGPLRAAEEDDPAYAHALALRDVGILLGYPDGSFGLDRQLKRSESVVILLRALCVYEEAGETAYAPVFTDVPDGHWAAPYILYAYEKGMTKGVSKTAFAPDRYVTAKEFCTLLLRYLLKSPEIEPGTVYDWIVSKTSLDAENIAALFRREVFLRADMVEIVYKLCVETPEAPPAPLEPPAPPESTDPTAKPPAPPAIIPTPTAPVATPPPATMDSIVFPDLAGFEKTVDYDISNVSYTHDSGTVVIVLDCFTATAAQLAEASGGWGPELEAMLLGSVFLGGTVTSSRVVNLPGLGRNGLELDLDVSGELITRGMVIPLEDRLISVLGVAAASMDASSEQMLLDVLELLKQELAYQDWR